MTRLVPSQAMAKRSVLIVDDEANILATVRRSLELDGFEVEVAGASAAALAWLERRPFDCVLLDVMMPDVDGLATLERIRAAWPELPVVMMSGHGSIDTAVAATRLGARDFLEKPLGAEKLRLTLENAIGYARLARDHARLTARVRADAALIGGSPRLRAILEKIRVTAPTAGRVLITGENGTGKELVARALHEQSRRADRAFVKVNCAAIPQELIESELFGHEKGAFTGAAQLRRGRFEQADEGTLFLDEIGDMSPSAQAKVLRVLQEGELERVGGSETIRVDVRVVAATNKDLPAEIRVGRFREDLYYRLNVVPIHVPPLREHKEDLLPLVEHFLRVACRANDRRLKRLSDDALARLMTHDWPGNVRELKNAVERLVILTGEAAIIEAGDVDVGAPAAVAARPRHTRGIAFKDLAAAAEREIVVAALEANGHLVAQTARELQLERSHLYKKMRALGIRPRGGEADGEE